MSLMKLISISIIILLNSCTLVNFNKLNTQIIDRGEYKVNTSILSTAQNDRIRFLILHYTALDDEKAFKVLTTGGNVSAHYLIPLKPSINNGKPVVWQLVSENKRAWHVGFSSWRNYNNINDTSIGIEIVNLGYIKNSTGLFWYPFNCEQINLIIKVCQDIISRYHIQPINILAHSDIAPLRKSDPGPLFPWETLFKLGIGAWPDTKTVNKYLAGRNPKFMASVSNIQIALAKYGYAIPQNGQLDEDTRKVIRAFQMHFRSDNINGDPDIETEAIILALLEKYK